MDFVAKMPGTGGRLADTHYSVVSEACFSRVAHGLLVVDGDDIGMLPHTAGYGVYMQQPGLIRRHDGRRQHPRPPVDVRTRQSDMEFVVDLR